MAACLSQCERLFYLTDAWFLQVFHAGGGRNFEFVPDPETYLHRVGRTGRFGRKVSLLHASRTLALCPQNAQPADQHSQLGIDVSLAKMYKRYRLHVSLLRAVTAIQAMPGRALLLWLPSHRKVACCTSIKPCLTSRVRRILGCGHQSYQQPGGHGSCGGHRSLLAARDQGDRYP